MRARSSRDTCAKPILCARIAKPISMVRKAATSSPAQGSICTTRRLTTISNARPGNHNNVNRRRVRWLFPVRDSLRTFAHSSGPRVSDFTGTNQKPIFFQNQLRWVFVDSVFAGMSGLPLMDLVHLLAQCLKRPRREDGLDRQAKVFRNLES